jgi:hypothetical protein
MKPIECEFEAEVLAAVWSDDLRAHVRSCAVCSDVALVAAAMDAMRTIPVIPDSGRVWWLAQMRARREATRAAGRPITAVQVIALACAMGLLGACFGATSLWFQSALRRFSESAFLAEHGLIVLAMAFILMLIPAAVYLALGRE